jgi:hypothetical protein
LAVPICSSIRWKLSSSHSPAGLIRWFADTASVNLAQTPINTLSFAANRLSNGSCVRRGDSRCAAASVLPYRSIWSVLNNSDRSGGSSTGGVRDSMRVRNRDLNQAGSLRLGLLFVTNGVVQFRAAFAAFLRDESIAKQLRYWV